MSLGVLAWDHPRATVPLAASSQAWQRLTGEPLAIRTRSLRSFGDDVPSAAGADLVLIDHPHVGQAAADGTILALDDLLGAAELAALAADSAGPLTPPTSTTGNSGRSRSMPRARPWL